MVNVISQARRTPARRAGRPLRAASRAQDILIGYVRAIIDGRTIDLNLLDASPEQRERYRGSEVVRLLGAVVEDHPAAACADLRERIHHRRVRCFVHGRDEAGLLLAVVVPVAD